MMVALIRIKLWREQTTKTALSMRSRKGVGLSNFLQKIDDSNKPR